MANFKYVGQPTAGEATKDIKLPCLDGSFLVIENVEPGVSIITVVDECCVEYMHSNPNFVQQ